MIVTLNRTDITSVCGTFTYSGSLSQVARVLNMNILNNTFINKINIGSELVIKDNNIEIFQGYVWSIEVKTGEVAAKLIAFNPLIYLTKNICSKGVFNNVPIKNLISSVCDESGLVFDGILGVNNAVTINARGKSLYQVIRLALDELSKQTGKLYHVEYINRKLHIMTGGETASNVISYRRDTSIGTLLSKTYQDTLDTMVSKVLISDKQGKIVDSVSSENETKYGSVSVVTNDKEKAKNLLKAPKTSLTVSIISDFTYLSGRAVEVEVNGSKEHFLITGDTHNYSSTVHTATLTLERW